MRTIPNRLGDASEAYWLALGKFVDSFSKVEASIQILLWFTANTPPSVSKAVFSGTKTDAACSFIRRIYEAHGKPLPDDLTETFAQLSAINKVRNDIVHYGASFDGTELYASNELIAMPGKERKTTGLLSELANMHADLDTINARISLHFLQTHPKVHSDLRDAVAAFQERAAVPWRYIPPEQRKADTASRSSPRKPKRRPQSSRD